MDGDQRPSTPAPRRLATWIVRAVAAVAGLAAVAIAAALAAVHTDWGRERVREQVRAQLAPVLAGPISIGAVEGSLLGRFSLRDVAIADATGRRAIAAARITVDYDPTTIVSKTLHVERLEIEAPEIHARVGRDGALNLAELAVPSGEPKADEPSSWTVRVDDVILARGLVTYEDDGARTTLEDLHIRAAARVAGDALELDLERARTRWREADLELSASGSISRRGSRIAVRDADLRAGDSRLAIPALSMRGSEAIHGALTARLRAADLRAAVPGTPWIGDAAVAGTVWRASAEQPIALALAGTVAGAKTSLRAGVRPEGAAAGGPAVNARLSVAGLDPGAAVAGAPAGLLDATVTASATGGAPAAARGTARLDVAGTVAGIRLREVTADAELREGVVRGSIAASTRWARARAEASVEVGAGAPAVTSSNLAITISDLGAALAAGARAGSSSPAGAGSGEGPAAAGGSAAVTLTATGPLDALAVQGRVRGRSLRFGELRVRRLRGTARVTGAPAAPSGTASITAIGTGYGGAALGPVRADVDVGERGRTAALEVDAGTDDTPFAGSGRVVADLRGDAIRVRLARLAARTRDLTWEAAGGTAVVQPDGAVDLGGVELRSAAGAIAIEARADPGGAGAARVDVRELDLGRVRPALAPGAPAVTGTADARIRGRWDAGTTNLRGRVKAALSNLAVAGAVPATDVDLDLRLAHRRADATVRASAEGGGRAELELRARTPARAADAAAWSRLGLPALERLSVDVSGVKLPALAGALEVPAVTGGTLSASIEVGSGAETATASADLAGFGYGDAIPAANAHLEVTLDGRDVTAAASAGVSGIGGTELALTGRLPPRRFDAAALRAAGEAAITSVTVSGDADLAALSALVANAPPVEGTAAFEIEAGEGLETGSVRLRADGLRAQDQGLPLSAEVRAELRPDRTTASLSVGVGAVAVFGHTLGRTRVVSGDVELGAGTRAALAGAFDRLANAPLGGRVLVSLPLGLARRALELNVPVGGRARAKVALAGTARDPRMTAWLDASSASVAGISFERFRGRAQVTGSAASARVRIRQRRGEGAGAIDLEAEIPFDDPAGAALAVRAREFDVGFLSAVLEAARAPITGVKGTLTADLSLRPDLADPGLDGVVRLDRGALEPVAARPLRDVSATVRFDGGRASAVLSARSERGRVEADARATLTGITPRSFRASVRANDYPIPAGGLTALLDLDARIAGDLRGDRRDGDFWDIRARADEVRVRIPATQKDRRELYPTGPEMNDVVYAAGSGAREGATPSAGEDPRGRPAARVTLSTPNDVIVRGEDVSAQIETDLTVTMMTAGVAIDGHAAVVRGHVRLFDRRYELARARVSFGGRAPPNPRLDVRLKHAFDVMTLTIDVGGTAEQPSIGFSSEPATYGETQLLQFALGGSPDTGSGPPRERSLDARASGAATALVAEKVGALVKKTFPIDVLRVGSDPDSEGVDSVTVGKWVTEDLFVAYRRRLDPEPDQNADEAHLDYHLTRRWTIETRAGAEAGSVDLLWIKRY